MIKRSGSYMSDKIEKMRGGHGTAIIEHLLKPDELYEKGRLFAVITLEPGASIGYHVHEGEMESFYILSGQAEYSDGLETSILQPGDTTLTLSGEGHTIKCAEKSTLKLLALILYR